MRQRLAWIALLLFGCGGPPEPTAEDQRLVDAWLDRLEADLDSHVEGTVLECEARERGTPSPFQARRARADELSRARSAAAEAASRGVQRRVWLRFSRVFHAAGRLSERASALRGACTSEDPPPSADVRRELEGLRREVDEGIERSRREARL